MSTPPVPDSPPAPVEPWHASRDSRRRSPAGMGRGRRLSAVAPLVISARPRGGQEWVMLSSVPFVEVRRTCNA